MTDRDGPVAGALVVLAHAGLRGVGVERRARSDAVGRFDFGEQRAILVRVSASAAGRRPAAVSLDLRSPALEPAPDALALELLDCDHTAFGTVHDSSGGAIVGATVEADGQPAGAATTDDAGAGARRPPARQPVRPSRGRP